MLQTVVWPAIRGRATGRKATRGRATRTQYWFQHDDANIYCTTKVFVRGRVIFRRSEHYWPP